MTLLDVIDDWKEIISNTLPSEYSTLINPIKLKRDDDNISLFYNGFLLCNEKPALGIPANCKDEFQKRLSELQEKHPEYEISTVHNLTLKIEISKTSQEMAQEIQALRKRFKKPHEEIYYT
ncbi:hypothetical protein GOV12_05160 [Candidatus Pacearchaeota archaeon]|nr:hypothetical protein [Candidatus Pacearchaeota archaeon]